MQEQTFHYDSLLKRKLLIHKDENELTNYGMTLEENLPLPYLS